MAENDSRVDLEKLRRVYEAGRKKREAAGRGSVTLRATAKLVKDAYLEGRIGKYTFACDEPPDRGGDDKAPSPLEYFLMGAAF